jgi:reactive intermediate/imine deaminase
MVSVMGESPSAHARGLTSMLGIVDPDDPAATICSGRAEAESGAAAIPPKEMRAGSYYPSWRQVRRSIRTSTARPSRHGGLLMARIPIAPPGMKDQRPRYTLGWRVGNTIYVAGQLPYDKDGNLVGKGDIKAQTRRIFEQIKMIVEAGGGKMDDVVKVTVFVTDVRYREVYGEVRSEFFGPNPPASTLVQISNLAVPDALIEIEAVAALDG